MHATGREAPWAHQDLRAAGAFPQSHGKNPLHSHVVLLCLNPFLKQDLAVSDYYSVAMTALAMTTHQVSNSFPKSYTPLVMAYGISVTHPIAGRGRTVRLLPVQPRRGRRTRPAADGQLQRPRHRRAVSDHSVRHAGRRGEEVSIRAHATPAARTRQPAAHTAVHPRPATISSGP